MSALVPVVGDNPRSAEVWTLTQAGEPLTIHVQYRPGDSFTLDGPGYDLEVLTDSEAREVHDRLYAATINLGYKWPTARIIISRYPCRRATVPRDWWTGWDAPTLRAILALSDQCDLPSVDGNGGALTYTVGSLGLDGTVHEVPIGPGVPPAA